MIGGEKRDIEVVCPTCKEKLVVSPKSAERGVVRCSRGHEIQLAKALDFEPSKPSRG